MSPQASRAADQVVVGVEPDELVSEGFATGSAVMDGILEHSQQRMLEAIEQLSRRVDTLAGVAGDLGPPPQGPNGSPMLASGAT